MPYQGQALSVFNESEDTARLVSETNGLPVNIGKNLLSYDAWGRPKVTHDYSLFHGVWTYSVPNRIWEEFGISSTTYTALTSTGTLATSTGNMLVVSSGTTADEGCYLRSKRSPRYQPNRGHLYSTAVILPTAEADGRRKFGLFCNGAGNANGIYFELEGDGANWKLYAVRLSNGVVKIRADITSLVPAGYDPEKGHVYDIQYQWRGVGNYKFFIDLQEVYADNILGTLTELSLRMPALPAAYECHTDTTTDIVIKAGCVDITSEGGKESGRQFASISTGETLLDANVAGSAMVAIRIPRTLTYDSETHQNTRDLVASKLTSWTRDESAVQVYFARDIAVTNLDGLTWLNMPDSTAQYLIGGKDSNLDDAFQLDRVSMQLVLNEWDDLEQKNIVINPDANAAPFYITSGDIMVIAVKSIAGTDDNATTVYLSEEI